MIIHSPWTRGCLHLWLRGRDVFDDQPRPWRSKGLECRWGSEVCSHVCTTARQGLSPARGCQPSAHASLTQPWPPEAADLWGVTGRGGSGGAQGTEPWNFSLLHQNDPGPSAQRPQTFLLLPEGTDQLQRAQCPTARSLHTAVHITCSALTPAGVVFPRGGTATCPGVPGLCLSMLSKACVPARHEWASGWFPACCFCKLCRFEHL